MSMGKKGKQAPLTLDLKVIPVSCHLDAVNRLPGQAICRTQNLDWTDQIKFLTGGTVRTMTRRCLSREILRRILLVVGVMFSDSLSD